MYLDFNMKVAVICIDILCLREQYVKVYLIPSLNPYYALLKQRVHILRYRGTQSVMQQW